MIFEMLKEETVLAIMLLITPEMLEKQLLLQNGLGKYLAHYYGMDYVDDYFSADYWKVTENWQWNKKHITLSTLVVSISWCILSI